MLFNSIEFFFFFPLVYGLYLFLNHRWQNRMLVAASYVFYGAWDWRFLSLIFISTVIDYFCGIRIFEAQEQAKRKFFLFLSIFCNLGILAFFKYYNFFAESFQDLLAVWGLSAELRFLNIVLPVGISFYTFQTMSYTLDVYRRELKATHNFRDFMLYVSFFPQLVAGPIERARTLLPQITGPRRLTLDQVGEGCYLIVWGYFLKVLIADNLARIADPIFSAAGPYHFAQVIIGVYAFAFQIFCDFAGYSAIARGLAKCMGIDLMVNFNLPYFSTNPSEFWQRWHISLSTWLRDYLYIPLGGNRQGSAKTYRNLLLTMLLGGLWHGAAWTFVIWGIYHGILLIVHRLLQPIFRKVSPSYEGPGGGLYRAANVFVFFHLVCLGWLFFRAPSIGQAGAMLAGLLHTDPAAAVELIPEAAKVFCLVVPLLFIQFFQYIHEDLYVVFRAHWVVRGTVYFLLIAVTMIFGAGGAQQFIYFQF